MNSFQPSCALLPGLLISASCHLTGRCSWLNILHVTAVLILQIIAISTNLEKLNSFIPAPYLREKGKENEPYLVFSNSMGR